MEIIFTRDGERRYSTIAVRDDGVTLRVPAFDQPKWIPHDLAHYVIEQALHLRLGFWGCVAAGAIFPGMRVISGRQPPHAAARSHAVIRETVAGQYGTEAEAQVAFFIQITQQHVAADRATAYLRHRMWQPGKSTREPLCTDDVRRVCTELYAMQERWQVLAIGQNIIVTWPHAIRRKR
ncbi:MAG: hypothetical protein ACRDHP_09775 [Ktedonobacterales bacterium]